MPIDHDTELIKETLLGNEDSFAELVRRHKQRVFGIASRFCRGSHELEDVCQEIFLTAFQKLGKFRGDAPFEHWLSRIAVRKCYDMLRKRKREKTWVSLEETELPLEVAAGGDKARRTLESAEVLHVALLSLRPEERIVITLLELEERSVREVAALTGWSESNVKVRAFRARKALKRRLELERP